MSIWHREIDRAPKPFAALRRQNGPAHAQRMSIFGARDARTQWRNSFDDDNEALTFVAVALFLIYALALLVASAIMAGVVFVVSAARRLAGAEPRVTPPASFPHRRA